MTTTNYDAKKVFEGLLKLARTKEGLRVEQAMPDGEARYYLHGMVATAKGGECMVTEAIWGKNAKDAMRFTPKRARELAGRFAGAVRLAKEVP